MDAFNAFKIYLALKSHFTNKNYDYFKYGGRTKASRKTFENRSDKYFFTKLAAKKDDIVNILVANFIHGDTWVGDIVNEQVSEDRYRHWKKKQESLTYIFSNELDKLNDDFNTNLEVKEGQHPHLLKLYLKQEVSAETVLIINDLTNVFRYWNKNITDTIIWPHHCFVLKKYRPFFTIDLDRYRSIVLSRFDK
jgi:T4 gene Gp59 loader of gp41 DNA helicase/T4 gene Gp59 loader of gp41 DNA helicase C-term